MEKKKEVLFTRVSTKAKAWAKTRAKDFPRGAGQYIEELIRVDEAVVKTRKVS